MSVDGHPLTHLNLAELAERANAIGWRAIVKLHPGHDLPDYVVLRSRLAECFCTVDVPPGAWTRLAADPAVESVRASRAMPV